MPPAAARPGFQLQNNTGLAAQLSATGTIRRFDCGGISIALFPGNELEAGTTNLYLRAIRDGAAPPAWIALLGPGSATRFHQDTQQQLTGVGSWQSLEYRLQLVLARDASVWFWHIELTNRSRTDLTLDLTYAQDLALAPYGAIRMNEFYVSQYIDHTPLAEERRGVLIASRQNQAAEGRYPWSLLGALGRGSSYATDALQLHGTAARAALPSPGVAGQLPAHRLQHEHSMVVIRAAALPLPAGAAARSGFFGCFEPDHPAATGSRDLERLPGIFALAAAQPAVERSPSASPAAAQSSVSTGASLFSHAPVLATGALDDSARRRCFTEPYRHEEHDAEGRLLSFFAGAHSHVVLQEKELRVLRPHGHLLRTGWHLTPDESALTSTVWMSGVFHSMVTQGHVSINRFLSTVRSYLGLFRSQGLRVFAEIEGRWQLLHMPSAFEMNPHSCRWIYQHAQGLIEVGSEARSDPHELTLRLAVTAGPPARFLITLHVALNGDDGNQDGAVRWRMQGQQIVIAAPPDTDVGRRFPDGAFRIVLHEDCQPASIGGDELLFLDGQTRAQPYLCIVTAATKAATLGIRAELIDANSQQPLRAAGEAAMTPLIRIDLPGARRQSAAVDARAAQAMRLGEWLPWLAQNAWVHYLSPRGLEQYSGGGWGTRDVCQGPVELLLALGELGAVRDLLLRVMSNQNPDGDWPQWFMFFERERGIRAGDSHGDIVFWPVLVLAQYLLASGDAAVLDEVVRFYAPGDANPGEAATVWQHAERALKLMRQRVIAGTALAAYGHGDWNDALQPADPALRESLCSAWTVTLHYQTLCTLSQALRRLDRAAPAEELESWALSVRADFQRLLLVDGVLAGYAHFEQGGPPRYLLHPQDATTGVQYSALAMIHAMLEDVFTPQQAREHLQIIESKLTGPDGVRLFDQPLPYHGGQQRIFQRAETATFFGREIGLMYTHAHLRYAQALAHLGEAERFLRALSQANPIALASVVPTASLRQANCYYSSSDARFADRYQASSQYARVAAGTVALDGGWRVYSSGAGIALALIVRHFLGVTCQSERLLLDPVIPASLGGLEVRLNLLGRPFTLHYAIGARGCGVSSVCLNGHALAFERAPNPHRTGMAILAMSDVQAHLQDEANDLRIELS